MPRRNLLIAIAAAIVVIAGAVGAYFFFSSDSGSQTASAPEAVNSSFPSAGGEPSGPPGALPDPVVVVLDRAALLGASTVGQDINRQMQAFTNAARDRLAGERRALENEARALQAEGVTEAERAKRLPGLQAREQRFMAASGREENILKATMAAAHAEVGKAMGPIIADITKQRGVNMVLDRAAVMLSPTPDFDITPEVIKALDAKMPTHQVALITPK